MKHSFVIITLIFFTWTSTYSMGWYIAKDRDSEVFIAALSSIIGMTAIWVATS